MSEQPFLNGRIRLHSSTGGLSLSFPPAGSHAPGTWTPIRDATTSAHYRLNDTPRRLAITGPSVSFGASEDLVTFSKRDDHLRMDWCWMAEGDTLESWLEVTNIGTTALILERLHVLELTGPASLNLPGSAGDWSVLQNGWQSWTPSGVRRVSDGPFPGPVDEAYQLKHMPHGPGGLRSEWVTVIAALAEPGESPSPTNEAPAAPSDSHFLLLGFVTGADQLAEICLEVDDQFQSLAAICHNDGTSLDPGQTVRSERLQVITGLDGWGALEAWAERMGELMQARVPEKTPTGWCTWYFYFGHNTAQDVYANLGAMRRQRLPLSLVMVDDGYQTAIGDWLEPNLDRFPDMAAVAATIRREGRMPGIWTAPFGLAADSQTFASHPDWVVRDGEGAPALAWQHLGCPVYALDTTHPEAVDWLRSTFRSMRGEWGYEAFKIDFLFAAALPGQRWEGRVTRAQALRRGLAIIRDAVGKDAFLLGCGAPLGPAVGIVDGMRIGPDVSPTWEALSDGDLSAPGTANALRNSIARAFTHLRLWAADPDCLLARPRGNQSGLSLYETRTLATVLTLTGGMLIDSDRLAALPPSRLSLLRQTLPPTDRTAIPLDLFEHGQPEILVLPVERPWGRWWLVGLINWGNSSRAAREIDLAALGLPPGRYHVYDQWRTNYLGLAEGRLALPSQRSHETFLLLFKPVTDRPDWLTSTFHLAGGSVEVIDVIRQKLGERRQKLVVHVEQHGQNFGRLVFTVPEGWVVLDAQVKGRRRSVNIRDGRARLVDMGFTLRDRGWVLVDFARL